MKWKDYVKEIKSLSEEEKMYIELVADIVSLREDRGITQAQLAEMTGLKQSAIARFEGLSENANTITMLKLINALKGELIIRNKTD